MNNPRTLTPRARTAENGTDSPDKMLRKKTIRNGLILLVVLCLIVVVWLGGQEDEAALDKGSTYTAARSDLTISVIEGGNLKAQKSVKIECEVEGQSTVVFLIPEGTYVKEGDLLVQLDSSDLEERFTQQEIAYESAKAAKIQAEENLKIQESQNKSDIMAGELSAEFAQNELEKYTKEDGSMKLSRTKLENAIKLAKAERERAKNSADWTLRLKEKGFVTAEELKADQLTLERREKELEEAEKELELARVYDFPMQSRRLEADLEEAKLGLERIQRRADSQMAQKEADLRSRDAQFRLQEERFNKLKEQLEKCEIHAPQDGLVVYGSQEHDRHRGGGSDDMIEEGATVRYRQTLITLPDVSVMMVDTKVHESAVDKVKVGMKARINIDAFPDEEYWGEVTKVAILPDSQSRWLNPDLKVYSTDITLENGTDKLKPGMSAKVEIIVDRLKDVLSIPIQAVYRRSGKEVCYVAARGKETEVRPVVVGLNNEQFVVILDGLQAGESVLLFEPALGEDLDEESPGEEEQSRPGDSQRKQAPSQERMSAQNQERSMPTGNPEMRAAFEKFRDMTPEQRAQAFEKMKAEGKIPQGGQWPEGEARRERPPNREEE